MIGEMHVEFGECGAQDYKILHMISHEVAL